MNTYWRLLGFAKPIEKYAIPYFFYTLFYAAFNTFNFVLVMPILDTLFQQDTVEAVRQMRRYCFSPRATALPTVWRGSRAAGTITS